MAGPFTPNSIDRQNIAFNSRNLGAVRTYTVTVSSDTMIFLNDLRSYAVISYVTGTAPVFLASGTPAILNAGIMLDATNSRFLFYGGRDVRAISTAGGEVIAIQEFQFNDPTEI